MHPMSRSDRALLSSSVFLSPAAMLKYIKQTCLCFSYTTNTQGFFGITDVVDSNGMARWYRLLHSNRRMRSMVPTRSLVDYPEIFRIRPALRKRLHHGNTLHL
jgi:hypothetical protein